MHPQSGLIKIGIHGVPRSGTSWLGQILNSSPNVLYKFQPLFSYELKSFLNEHSAVEDVEMFFEHLSTTSSEFLDQLPAIKQGIVPGFAKSNITHIVYKEVRYNHIIENILDVHPGIKIIGIIRNPLAVLASWFESEREFRRDLGWRELDEWRLAALKNEGRIEEFFGYEKWKEVALLFERLAVTAKERFHLISYDQLLRDTQKQLIELFRFCGLEITTQTMKFIEQSRSVEMPETYSVFKSKQNDQAWQGKLDPFIVSEVLADLENSPLKKYLEE